MNEKKFFEAFIKNNNNPFNLYQEIKVIIQSEIIEARGVENAKFYDFLVELANSENNSGWKERHSERIEMINRFSCCIAEDYNEYLP